MTTETCYRCNYRLTRMREKGYDILVQQAALLCSSWSDQFALTLGFGRKPTVVINRRSIA